MRNNVTLWCIQQNKARWLDDSWRNSELTSHISLHADFQQIRSCSSFDFSCIYEVWQCCNCESQHWKKCLWGKMNFYPETYAEWHVFSDWLHQFKLIKLIVLYGKLICNCSLHVPGTIKYFLLLILFVYCTKMQHTYWQYEIKALESTGTYMHMYVCMCHD